MQSPHETGVDTKTKKPSEANESIKRILDNTVATNNITEEGGYTVAEPFRIQVF